MKRFSLPLIAALLILCSCGSAEAKEPAAPKTVVEVVTDWTTQNNGEREVVVNGRHCIEVHYLWNEGSNGIVGSIGISCNWNKGGGE